MTGLPFFEGFAPASLHTLDACLDSATAELAEPRIDLDSLAHETVTAVIPHRDGYRLCFASGTVIHVERGHTFDVAGNPVIEP